MLGTRPPRHLAELIHGPLNGGDPPHFARDIRRAIYAEVLSMGLPSMTGFLVASLYELVNMFWLARIGPAPVAAVTMSTTIIWILGFGNMVVGTGSLALISRRFGANDLVRTEQAIKTTFLLKFLTGTVPGLIGIAALPWALTLMGASPEVKRLAITYGTLQLAMLGVAMMSYSVYTSLRCMGRPRSALWIQVLSAGINCALDPLLIFGWGPVPALGIFGAAVATSIAQLTVVVTGAAALEGPRSAVRVRWLKAPFPNLAEAWQMFRIGFAGGINSLSFALATMMVVRLVAGYGTVVVAIYGMSIKVLQFGIWAVVGLGLGTGALVGQFLGSGDLRKAWLSGVLSIRLAGWTMLGFAVAVLAGAPLIVRLFFTDPALIESGIVILRIMAFSLPFIGVHIGAETVFEGAGQNIPPMVLSIVHSWVMVIPLMYLAGSILELGPTAVMVGWGLAHIFGGIAGLYLFRRGSWLKHQV